MVIMKSGDEDLVEDETSFIGKKEDESQLDQKIPTQMPKKAALAKNTKPFSFRLKSGELNIDIGDIHAVANQMIFEINLLAGKTLTL